MYDGSGKVADGEHEAAAYVSWPAFDKTLWHLANLGPPDVVQRSHLDALYTPTVVNQSMAALRHLGLTDDDGRSTPDLCELLAVRDTPDWPRVLRRVIGRAYPQIVALDLANATAEQLHEEFRSYGSKSPAVQRKMELFFLAAAREAGIPLSAELAEPRRRLVAADPAGRRAHLERLGRRLADRRESHENGARDLPPNPSPAAPSIVSLPQPREPAAAALDHERERNRAAFAALTAAWNPTKMPEEVDAAVVTLLRYFRKTEAEATKA